MDNNKSTKSDSRIASILGTWTGLTNLKTDVGKYSLKANYILHVVCDSMRVNSCSLPGCSEMDNQICARPLIDNKKNTEECHPMQETVSDWSDVSVFLFADVLVEGTNGLYKYESTGDWIGPYSVVLGQNKTAITTNSPPAPGDIVDQYTTKYVETPSTPYLNVGENFTFCGEDEFETILGKDAVKNTVARQSELSNSSFTFNGDIDPYIDFYETCDNGQIKPMLPIMDFIFVVDKDGTEKIEVKLHHRLLVTPKPGTMAYKSMSLLTRFLPISGPYCYNDDPKGSFTFDVDFDSTEQNIMLTLEHACVEGLPCAPPALVQVSQSPNEMKPNQIPGPVMIEVGTLISLSVALAVVAFLFLVSVYFNLQNKTIFSKANRIRNRHNLNEAFEEISSIPSQVAFEHQVEMKETPEEDGLRTSLLQKNLNVGSTQNGIMFV